MEEEIIDYASLSDAELSPIIYDLIDQGLSENEINQKLWGSEIDDPNEVDTFAWDNFLASTDEKIQNLEEGTTRVGDFIYGKEDIFNPTHQVDRSITLPGYRKKTNTMIYYPNNPERNKAIEKQLIDSGKISGDETMLDFFDKNGYELAFEKGEGGELYETWKQWDRVDPQNITEDEYNRTQALYDGVNIRGYKNGLSFEEYAAAWDTKIGETTSIWDPKLSSREKELKLKIQNELKTIGDITENNEGFLNDLTNNSPKQLQNEFFNVIKTTGELLELNKDERNEIVDGGKRLIETADFTERDKMLKAMFGSIKGDQIIDYLNANPQEYLDMIDAGWQFGETIQNISSAFGSDGEGPKIGGFKLGPDSIERNNTDNFLEKIGIIAQGDEPSLTPEYAEWLNSEEGAMEKFRLLQNYKSRKINKFLRDNAGGYFFGTDEGEFFPTSVRDKDGSEVYGFGSEALRFTSPENEKIYQNNKKTQQEFMKHAQEIGYTGSGLNFAGNLNLKIGQPVTLGSGATAHTYELQPFIKPSVQQEYINNVGTIIKDVSEEQFKKYEIINEKAAPYFEEIQKATDGLEFFDFHDEWYRGGMPLEQQADYKEALKKREVAIDAFLESGVMQELNDQYSILTGLEEVNDTFYKQGEALDNLGMMTESAFYNQSNITRTMNAFARTGGEIMLAMGMLWNEGRAVFNDDLEAGILNKPWLNAYEMMSKASSEEFAPKLDYDTLLPGEGGDYIMQTLAESAPTLAMVMGPSALARMGTKSYVKAYMNKATEKLIQKGVSRSLARRYAASPRLRNKLAQRILDKASAASMGMFMVTSYSGRKLQMEYEYAKAPEKIIQIEKMLENLPDANVSQRLELLNQLNTSQTIVNSSKASREVDAVMYGLIDGLSERLGTLTILNKVRGPMKSWKNLNRIEKWKRAGSGGLMAGKAMSVEVFEEVAAQYLHNFTDKVVLGQDKSIFEGIDSNLVMDSVINILAMQTPSYMGNVGRVIRDEVTTFKDKQAQAKRGKEIREFKAKLQTVKDPKERMSIINKIGNLMQEANIAEFSSYQRFRHLTNEQIDELVELGGKRAKVNSRYLEHMSLMPDGKNVSQMSKWQKETKALEAQLTNLRNQQGEILNTAQWKRYQNFTKIANEYTQLKETTEEQDLEYIGAKLQVKKDLGKGFTGEKLKDDTDIVSVLPKEIRHGSYQAYQAFKDLTINFGDVVTQNKTDYLENAQDVMDFQAQENC